MEEARSVLPFVKSIEKKYNVLYVNTPWDALDTATLSKFPASSITPDNAALFMWVDSYTVVKAAKLIEEWGFEFHSVYQVMDVAKHPWMETKSVSVSTDTDNKDTPENGDSAKDTPENGDSAKDTPENSDSTKDTSDNAAKAKAPKKKAARKARAPPITPLPWWTKPSQEAVTPSRPTTEQLWLAVKGDPSKLFSGATVAFNVVNRPDLGKKSRSKKPATTDKFDTERPAEFLQAIIGHLTPEANVLNVFASSINATVDAWGPGIPGGYLSSMKANTGVVGVINKVLRSLKKTQLHELWLKLPKVLKKEEGASLAGIPTWPPIESAITTMAPNPGYDFKDDEGNVKNWVVKLVHSLSQDNMANFTLLHSKKKKRKVSADSNPDRQRHGIASKTVVSKELSTFLQLEDGETIARTQVVSLLNKYITSNHLKDPVKKNQINLDDKLKALLAPPEDFGVITFFNICRLLKPHFPKSKKALKEEMKAGTNVKGESKHVEKKARETAK